MKNIDMIHIRDKCDAILIDTVRLGYIVQNAKTSSKAKKMLGDLRNIKRCSGAIIDIVDSNQNREAEKALKNKYRIVAERHWADLEDAVNEGMDMGWIPIGGVFISAKKDGEESYLQAMIKRG